MRSYTPFCLSVSQAKASGEIVPPCDLQWLIILIEFLPKETLKTARFREQTKRDAERLGRTLAHNYLYDVVIPCLWRFKAVLQFQFLRPLVEASDEPTP